jgi:hypothetical protein
MHGTDLQQLLRQHAFESILWIGTMRPDEPHDSDQKIEYRDVAQIIENERFEGRWDLVIINDGLLDQPRNQVIHTISRIRDLHAKRLVVLFPQKRNHACSIEHEDLISLGLRALEDKPGIFYHDLYDYKDTPDWLNNQYWANPQNWDKYRW